MARVHLEASEPADALRALRAADAYWRERSPDSRWAGESAPWLGRAHLVVGQRPEGRGALARASRLLASSRIPADVALMKQVLVTRVSCRTMSSRNRVGP